MPHTATTLRYFLSLSASLLCLAGCEVDGGSTSNSIVGTSPAQEGSLRIEARDALEVRS